jgi:hypothetical protein
MDIFIICVEKIDDPGVHYVHGECFKDIKIAHLIRDQLQANNPEYKYGVLTLSLYEGPKRIG